MAGGETEPELIAAVAGRPQDLDLALRLAERAAGSGDWRTAEWAWRRSLLLDGGRWRSHAGLAAALEGQKRASGAEAVLEAARARFPAEIEPAAAYARCAAGRGDHMEALRRWADVQEAFRDRADGWRGAATALVHLGRREDARDMLRSALALLPGEAGLLHDLGRIAELQADWPEAERCWRGFLAADPKPWGHVSLARALFRQGADHAARAALRENAEAVAESEPFHVAEAALLLDDYPGAGSLELMAAFEAALARSDPASGCFHAGLAYARAAKHRGAFQAYRDRAEALAARFEEEIEARLALAEARELWHRDDDLRDADPAPATDFGRFESLGGGGDRGGCDFGFLQRRHGLEPLGLLRWATIDPDRLADALGRRFDGLGAPGTVRVEAQDGRDWRAADAIYGICMDHTHLDRTSVDAATAVRQVSTRLRFLAGKLVADLAEAEKVFVYRMAGGGVAPDLLRRLSRAIASYGEGLLVVSSEDGSGALPVFTEAAPNLLVASHESFSGEPERTLGDIEPTWRAICARALVWQAEKRQLDPSGLAAIEVALRLRQARGQK